MKCVFVTSTRADFGLLRYPMKAVKSHAQLELKLIACGTHLLKHFGNTKEEILDAGFNIDLEVHNLEPGDDPLSTAKSLSNTVDGFANAFDQIKPDMVVVLGDRFEIFGAASAAVLLNYPIAHLCGGDVTEGAYDEAFRHSISKMAALHFPTHHAAAKRLEQMGEPSDRIFNIGNTGLDILDEINWMTKKDVFELIGLKPRKNNIIVTYHPVTRDPATSLLEITGLLNALEDFGPNLGIVFTGVNADTGGSEIQSQIIQFADSRGNAVVRKSLGHTLYLNAIRHMDAVVGNSSSGIYEGPALKTPTVDIGNRQKGRPQAMSVIHVSGDKDEILSGLTNAMQLDCSHVESLYGAGGSSSKFAEILARPYNRQWLLSKPFIDASPRDRK